MAAPAEQLGPVGAPPGRILGRIVTYVSNVANGQGFGMVEYTQLQANGYRRPRKLRFTHAQCIGEHGLPLAAGRRPRIQQVVSFEVFKTNEGHARAGAVSAPDGGPVVSLPVAGYVHPDEELDQEPELMEEEEMDANPQGEAPPAAAQEAAPAPADNPNVPPGQLVLELEPEDGPHPLGGAPALGPAAEALVPAAPGPAAEAHAPATRGPAAAAPVPAPPPPTAGWRRRERAAA